MIHARVHPPSVPRRKRVLALALAVPFFFACGFGPAPVNRPDAGRASCPEPARSGRSNPPDETSVRILGRVLRQDGTPGVEKVALIQPRNLGDLFLNFATLGLLCLSGNVDGTMTAGCERVRTATLDSQGAFTLTMSASASRVSLFGYLSPVVFHLVGAAPGGAGVLSGPWFETSVWTRTEELELPDLQLWEPTTSMTVDGGTATVTFSGAVTVPECFTPQPPALILETSKGERIWKQPVASGDSFDARLFEDWRGGASVAIELASQTSSDLLTVGGARLAFAGTSRPLSRGASCSVGATAYVGVDCAVSDGELGTGLRLSSDQPVVLDLGAARPVSLVVVRGELTDALVESSLDALAWTPQGVCQRYTVLRPAGGATARYVRVSTSATDGGVSRASPSIAELSVW